MLGLTVGVIGGLLEISVLLSLAALVYTGPLSGFVANGIGLSLVGTGVLSIVFALLSSRPAMIISIQEGPAIIVALIAATIAAGAPAAGAGEATYVTVLAAVALTTIATGITFVALGQFGLGTLVRYFPYPVIGGFLAGTGWLLALGGISVITGGAAELATIPSLLQPPVLAQWLPGMLFAIVMLIVLRRVRHVARGSCWGWRSSHRRSSGCSRAGCCAAAAHTCGGLSKSALVRPPHFIV